MYLTLCIYCSEVGECVYRHDNDKWSAIRLRREPEMISVDICSGCVMLEHLHTKTSEQFAVLFVSAKDTELVIMQTGAKNHNL